MPKPPNEHKLKPLRDELYGHYSEVARLVEFRTKKTCAVSTVTRVLDGEWHNADVITAACDVRDELRAEKQQLDERIKS